VQHLHRCLHTALEAAVRWGAVPRNMAGLVRGPRVPKHERATWTQAEANCFLAGQWGERWEALFRLELATGLRESELLGLRWSDVDLARRRLSVTRQLKRVAGAYRLDEIKTHHGRRSIELPSTVAEALREHHRRQAEERLAAGEAWEGERWGLVFCNAVGGPMDKSAVYHLFQRRARRLGLPCITFHDLRHTAATIALEEGVPVKVVSEMLGHSSVVVTQQVYLHVTSGMTRQLADVMDRIFGGSRG
jgi:integrase